MNDFALLFFILLLSSLMICSVLGNKHAFENFTTNSQNIANEANAITNFENEFI